MYPQSHLPVLKEWRAHHVAKSTDNLIAARIREGEVTSTISDTLRSHGTHMFPRRNSDENTKCSRVALALKKEVSTKLV